VAFDGWGGNRGGGENVSSWSISWSRMAVRECEFSHGGGRIFARRWRLSRSASHRGTLVRWGGLRGLMRPYIISAHRLRVGTADGRRCTIYGGVLAGHTYS
jgi:hypothetical protein